MKKRLLFVVPLLLLSMVFFISTGALAAKKSEITIGVVMNNFTSPYASAMVREYKKYTKEKGIGLVILDAQLDIQMEARNIDTLMAMGVDAIAVNPVDAEGSRAALKKAVDAGFIVICSNVTINNAAELGVRAYTGPDCYSEAVVAAMEAIRLKPDGNVVMITGTPGYSASIDREEGFTDTIAKEAPQMNILDIETGNWMREDAMRVMSDFITKYGDEIDIVYTHDDNMTVGAVNALKAAGYTLKNRPYIISIGAMADGLPLVKEGWIDSTCMQSPVADAQLSVDVAYIMTKKYKEILIDTPPITKANVQEIIDMHIWD